MMKMKANVRINAANGLNGAAILGQRPVIAYRQSARMCPALKFPSPMSAVPAIAHGLAFCLGVKKDKKNPRRGEDSNSELFKLTGWLRCQLPGL